MSFVHKGKNSWFVLIAAILCFITAGQASGAASQEPAPYYTTADQNGARVFIDQNGNAHTTASAGAAKVLSSTTGPTDPPHRLIVKFGFAAAQSLSASLMPDGVRVSMATAVEKAEAVSALLAKNRFKAARPLMPQHVAVRKRLGGSPKSQLLAEAKRRFPKRASRVAGGAQAPDLSTFYVLEAEPTVNLENAMQALRADPNVVNVEADRQVSVFLTPNDTSYDELWGLQAIGCAAAWDTAQGEGVVVAVVDTGVDYNHPDIAANMWTNTGEIPGNGIDDDRNGYIDDVWGWDFEGAQGGTYDNDPFDGHFHGTHVAGTVAAVGNNGLGVVGVAWKAKVMAVKGLSDGGIGSDSVLAKAIVYAVDNGADVINASWGASGTSQVLADAVDYAYAHGVLFVAAAGNSSAEASGFSPANIPNALAISALTRDGSRAVFSNFGAKIELAAPGADILSLKNDQAGYQSLNGTSMAAPHVAGVAALIIGRHPEYSLEQVRQVLRISATDIGAAGWDTEFGFGRIDAASAVLVTNPLEARINSVASGLIVSDHLPVAGTVRGPDFSRWVLDYGAGSTPVNWNTIATGVSTVANGTLGTLDLATIPDGIYTLRLRAFNTAAKAFTDFVQVRVRLAEISSPVPPAIRAFTRPLKPGGTYEIRGSARGFSFRSYLLEYAPGERASTGWSTAGIALANNGMVALQDALLAKWTPPANLRGYYTLRLSVADGALTRTATTVVYLEPDLITKNWPVWIPDGGLSDFGFQPIRQSDGSFKLLRCGDREIYLFNPDGTSALTPQSLLRTRVFQTIPAVGNLDGQPGDEIVIADGDALRVFSSNLTLLREIYSPDGAEFYWDQPILADLNGDGTLEIIAIARSSPYDQRTGTTASLYVYKANGALFSQNYPVPLKPPHISFDRFFVFVNSNLVVADLNGDGQKEIVLGVPAASSKQFSPVEFRIVITGYSIVALTNEGTTYTAWPERFVRNEEDENEYYSLASADLDADGKSELALVKHQPVTGWSQVQVLNSDGTTRGGWPLLFSGNVGSQLLQIAIGDLDGDRKKEVVAVSRSEIAVLREDGRAFTSPWSYIGNAAWGIPTSPLIADMDGDGRPEIITSFAKLVSDQDSWNYEGELQVHRANGSLVGQWPIFGMNGQQPLNLTPMVGDFNGDGKTDVVVNARLMEGGGYGGWLVNSTGVAITLNANFNAAASSWTGQFGNPRCTRTVEDVILADPVSRQVGQADAATFAVRAALHATNTYRWQRLRAGGGWALLSDDSVYSGVSSAILRIARADLGTSGDRFRCVVTNTAATEVSKDATLTVTSGTSAISGQPVSAIVGAGASANLSVSTAGSAATCQWMKDGVALAGRTGATCAITGATSADVGNYTAIVTDTGGAVTSNPAILGLTISAHSTGAASEVGANIVHPNGNTYDQFLLQGPSAAVRADPGQVVRLSFIDLSDDIVQVEFSGAGSVTINLANVTGPAAPANYNQAVKYMRGHARIVVAGADQTTNLSVFTVGRITAINQALFRESVNYDGVADIASISILSANGRFGSLRTANAAYFATTGLTGVYAPEVAFTGPVFIGNITAFDSATPVIQVGSVADARITGGDLAQDNGKPVLVSGLSALRFTSGTDSHGNLLPAQANQARLEENGVDVTAQLVTGGPP